MATIYEKFPGMDQNKIRALPVSAQWTANLAAGKYTFVNSDQVIFDSSAGNIMVLDGLILAANIDQLEFNRAIDSLFSIDVRRNGNRYSTMLQPFSFASFNQGANFSSRWNPTGTRNNQEQISFRLNGSLNQIPALAGVPSVTIYANAMLYLLD